MRAVFLNRDNTLNRLVPWPDGNVSRPWEAKQFKLFPYARKAVTLLKKFNFKVFVVSNQPGVQSGEMDISELLKMDKKLYSIGVDGVFNCVHEGTTKWKPRNQQIENIIQSYRIDRSLSYMIGQSEDIQAGFTSGLQCLYVGPDIYPYSQYDLRFVNVLEAAKYIQKRDKQ